MVKVWIQKLSIEAHIEALRAFLEKKENIADLCNKCPHEEIQRMKDVEVSGFNTEICPVCKEFVKIPASFSGCPCNFYSKKEALRVSLMELRKIDLRNQKKIA